MRQLAGCPSAGDCEAHLERLLVEAAPGPTIAIGNAGDCNAATLVFLRADLGVVVSRHLRHGFEEVVGYLTGTDQVTHPALDSFVPIARGTVFPCDDVELLCGEVAQGPHHGFSVWMS